MASIITSLSKLEKKTVNYRKSPNKSPLSNKRPLCAVNILLDAPYDSYSKILEISKKEQNHSIHSFGAAQFRSVTEIAPKSPLLCVNRSPIWYGFRAGKRDI